MTAWLPDVVHAGTQNSSAAAPLRAFLIRGLAGGRPFYFSAGLDALADKLKRAGVAATTHDQGSAIRPYGQVGAIAAAAQAVAEAGARPVLIGHSMGADAALKVAARLNAAQIAVPLVVCFDPTSFRRLFGPPPVPANVARIFNFYQRMTPLGRGRLTPAPDFRGHLHQEEVRRIHSRVDDDAALHARVLTEIAALGA